MKHQAMFRTIIAISILLISGCGGTGYGGGVRPTVGLGFYHGTYGHGWGGGYYRGYDRGVSDTVDTLDAVEIMDAPADMGMPDMDMGPAIDFDF